MENEKNLKKNFSNWLCWFYWNAFKQSFVEQWYNVIGIDNLNDYYDVRLKNDRLKILKKYDLF